MSGSDNGSSSSGGSDQSSIVGHESDWHTNSQGVEHKDYWGTREVTRSDGTTGSQKLDKSDWPKVHEDRDGNLW